MEGSSAAAWFSQVAEPLFSKFGRDLTLCRDGDAVRWEYAGQCAIVERTIDGGLDARFIDRPTVDAVSHLAASAVYRSVSPYALNRAGSVRMIADMVDFFSGVREPAFRFVDAA